MRAGTWHLRKKERGNNKSSLIPFKYQGLYEDTEAELYYNRFKYYDPNTGLFISQDPIGLASDEYNFYSYVHDTNNWIDPFGLEAIANKVAVLL